MKTINDLRDELSIQFGSILSGMEVSEMNIIMSFILTSFAYDFPEVNARAYKIGDSTTYKLYLQDLHDEFLEIQFMFPMQKLGAIASVFYKNVYAVDSFYTQIDEVYAIQLSSQYIDKMSTYYVPTKPMIMNDTSGEFVMLDKDVVIMYLTERVLNPDSIQEYVYAVLRNYAYYKFSDFLINRQFSNFMDVNQKIFDLIYGSISTDLSTGDLDAVTSVSLSGLSVSFASKLNNYSQTLSSLSSGFNNPTYIDEINKNRERQLTKFKRKKNVFYNYLY